MNKRRAFFLLILMIVLFPGTGFPETQPDASDSYYRGAKRFGVEVFRDTWSLIRSPMRWDASDWLTASLVAGTTGGLIALDDEIRDFVQNNRTSGLDDFSDSVGYLGEGRIALTALGGFYLYGNWKENEKAQRTARLGLESFLVSNLFTITLKATTGRHRPNSGAQSDAFSGFSTSKTAFPSGHTTVAFSLATTLASAYEDVKFVAPVSYGLATLASLSRINNNRHWASDVFLGAAIGYFTTKAIWRLHRDEKDRRFTILPTVLNGEIGVAFSYRY